jgi:hypothetical protein
MSHEPHCYFCLTATEQPVVTYVRWQRSRSHAFLCARHRDEHAEHVARDYPITFGIWKLDTLAERSQDR